MPRTLSSTKSAFIYVLASYDEPHRGSVKVGFSLWPDHRCEQLSKRLRERLHLIWALQTSRSEVCTIERMAHINLAKHRIDGEWFVVTPETAIAAIKLAVSDYHKGLRPDRGRAAPRLALTLPRTLIGEVEEWRSQQRPIPNKSEAARTLIERALEFEEERSKRRT